MPVQIEQILRRATQGRTKPFLCQGDDGHLYFVKGRGAGQRSMLAEWVAGHLARAFDLPVADFELVDIPPALIDMGGPFNLAAELGAGSAFGSRVQQHVQEISWPHLQRIDLRLQRDLLVFDWWIRNEDRYFSERGGNPNLLWDESSKGLVIIDHNLAFDPDFDAQSFQELHVFATRWQGVASDLVEQAHYQARCEAALAHFDQACNSAPEEWWWAGEDVPADFDREAVRSLLERCRGEGFWRVTT